MEGYIVEYNKGKTRKVNPEHHRLHQRAGIKAARQVSYHKYNDPGYRRMHYVRYADDFIITIIGPRSEAVDIKDKCTEFIAKLKLTLSPEKTLITHIKENPVPFLGYLIQLSPKQKYSYFRRYAGKLRKVSAIRGSHIYLKPDIQKIKKRLANHGFCKKNGLPIPNFTFLSETQYGTIIKASRVLRGIANYYKLARNYRDFVSQINYIIRYSVAKLFAAKYRLGSIAKVFAIAGKDLKSPLNSKSLRTKKVTVGQTEEKIYYYLESIGIPRNKLDDRTKLSVGIPFTKYNEIPKPDLTPLTKNFSLSFIETIKHTPGASKIDPLNSLN